jgi:hypothetical protein
MHPVLRLVQITVANPESHPLEVISQLDQPVIDVDGKAELGRDGLGGLQARSSGDGRSSAMSRPARKWTAALAIIRRAVVGGSWSAVLGLLPDHD